MSMVTLELLPRDLLFFRDGRPMDVDMRETDYRNVGHGAYWPRPDHFYNALMHAVIGRSVGEKEYGKHGDLRTAGPFPVKEGRVYFPRPLDWGMSVSRMGTTDLEGWLTHGFRDRTPSKKNYPSWVTEDELLGYLSGREPDLSGERPLLCHAERRMGNTLDDASRASAKSDGTRGGRYAAEYLRLADGVTMWAAADMGRADVPVPENLVMGGQGGMVRVLPNRPRKLSDILPVPRASGDGEVYVRWTLLTPAYYPETGWLPSFCIDTRKELEASDRAPKGTVMLKDVPGASLVGACTGKPVAYSGFDTLEGVKPTILVVPAGSVYLFKCADAQSANALMDKLHLVARSQNNNSGYGIGVCSVVSVG